MRLAALLAACALGVGLAAIGHAAEPVTVTVRFIDARNGKPYAYNKDRVQIFLYKSDPSKGFNSYAEARANNVGVVRQFPDANGEVTFALPNPMPGVIEIPAILTGCGPGRFDTKAVVEKGVVGENLCRTKLRKMNVKFEAKPGEIIYFVAPLSFWERLFR
ncbi:MAG: hypothetical protein ACRD3T_20980 [Terriglobia bacterium]